jgi:hypothetical protein
VRFAVAVALQHRDGQKGLHDPPESTTPVPMRDSQLAKKGLVDLIRDGEGGASLVQVNSNIPLFDRQDHPFVPTCLLAERRAQRQSRMPLRRRRHRHSRRAASCVSDMSDSSGGESPLCNLMEVKH